MKAYLFEIHVSDGNDNTIYDCVVEADTREAAENRIRAQVEKDGDGAWDGSDPDGYRVDEGGCDEGLCNVCPRVEECDGPAYTITTIYGEEAQEFSTVEEAEKARASYHGRWFCK